MRVHVNRHAHFVFELSDQIGRLRWRYQARHIFDGDDIGAEFLELLSQFNKIRDAKKIAGQLFAMKQCLGALFEGKFWVNRKADGAIGHAAIFFHKADGCLHIIDVVEGIKNAHNINT